MDFDHVARKAVGPNQWGIGMTAWALHQVFDNLLTCPIGHSRAPPDAEEFLNFDQVTLRKRETDRLADQLEAEHGFPISTFGSRLLGVDLSRNIFTLELRLRADQDSRRSQ